MAKKSPHVSLEAAPTGGDVVSGVRPNRDHKNSPDDEQKRRHAAREESRWAAGDRKTHPPQTRTNKHNPPSEP